MSHWILLRGLTRESRHWGDFVHQLGAALPDASILAVDLPGNGRLWRERSPSTVEAMVEDCRRQLQAAGLPPPWHLAGLSLGGMVATAWALAHPVEVAGLALLNTSFAAYSPPWRRLAPAAWPHGWSVLAGSPGQREEAILALTSHRPQANRHVLEDWVAWREECPVSTANALRQLAAAARYLPRRVPVQPALILAALEDRLVQPECSAALARWWGAPLALCAGAGHDLPLDAGPWVAKRIARWAAEQRMVRRRILHNTETPSL